jgi:putative membrane protein
MGKNTRIVLIIAGIALLLLVVVPSISGGISGWQGGWGMMGPGMMGGFGWGWSMPIFMVLFWVLIIWGVAALVGGSGRHNGWDSDPRPVDSALEVLKRRYVRGEIDREEYEGKRRDLA